MRNDDGKFPTLNLSTKIIVIVSITLFILFALSVVFGAFFFGFTGLFQLLDVQYDSIKSLFLFLLYYFIISLITELFSKIVTLILVSYLKNKLFKILIPLCLDTVINWTIIHFIDESMNSITIPTWVEGIIVLLLALADLAFDDKYKKKK